MSCYAMTVCGCVRVRTQGQAHRVAVHHEAIAASLSLLMRSYSLLAFSPLLCWTELKVVDRWTTTPVPGEAVV
jgi:hypothetical protein